MLFNQNGKVFGTGSPTCVLALIKRARKNFIFYFDGQQIKFSGVVFENWEAHYAWKGISGVPV